MAHGARPFPRAAGCFHCARGGSVRISRTGRHPKARGSQPGVPGWRVGRAATREGGQAYELSTLKYCSIHIRGMDMRSGVYVLQLQNGGYYVGKSDDIDARVQQHKSGGGSAWCRHKGGVVKEMPTVFHGSLGDISSWEMNETVTQMLLHGYANVRGWEFTSCGPLSTGELDTIKHVVMGQTDACRNCGNGGHFAESCLHSTVQAKWLVDLENMKKGTVSTAQSPMVMAAMSYEGASKQAVVASRAVGGSARPGAVRGGGSTYARGGGGGGGSYARGGGGSHAHGGGGGGGSYARGGGRGVSVRGGGIVKRSTGRNSLFCTRCGRETHVAAKCYARSGIDGEQLDDDDDDDDEDDEDDEDDDEF